MIQGSAEWLQARCGKATASRYADVMAEVKSGEAASRRNYRAELVVERLTGRPTEQFVSQAMREGSEREPLARIAYEARFRVLVQEVGFIEHDNGLCGASPDGLIGDDGGLEAKCPTPATHLQYMKSPTAPPDYMAQIQGGMWHTRRKWWDFISWNPLFPPELQLIRRRVPRDEDYIDKLAAAVKLFMLETLKEEAFALTYKES